MIIKTLSDLWNQKKRSLGKNLQKSVDSLAKAIRPAAESLGFQQTLEGHEIHWTNLQNATEIAFFYIPNPRELKAVQSAFQRTKDLNCELSCIFVHQWTDGEGNWDVFGLHPQRGLFHWNRFWGIHVKPEISMPGMRSDIYDLFSTGKDFPLISRKKWAASLNKEIYETMELLSRLAGEFHCIPKQMENRLYWESTNHEIEILFDLYQNSPSLDDYIQLCNKIQQEQIPVTFLIQRAGPEIFDIFRLSKVSYMEHHNQFK